ncbi:hypothetical protein PPSIR1_31253 [Plesiocystis pacifica SIR-1]|uniref:Uncharacterized protein n=1 Tax=Plesiocystis pacifica SIR-1 TaxID=391625 RepID=A6GDB3_9BACT|nr:tryptophan 7-halogenase [Plesiocystis pacifica]EDM76104.1 hypothetical protein PPSIR1_31253 [Plesiocystis pacifica SIR-1]
MTAPRVAIIGGGPAGAAAALTLARGGVEVVVVDASRGPAEKIGESLPPSVRPLLARLELLELLDAAAHRPSFGNRASWGQAEAAEEDFMFGLYGAGWHLDRRRFEAALAKAAEQAGARWLWDHHAVDARHPGGAGGWRLELEGPESLVELDARFILDATGRPARFAVGAGARRIHLDRLVGLALRFDSAGLGDGEGMDGMDGFTVVEAIESGWWYTAPLSGGRAIAVYMSDGDLFDTRSARTAGGWRALLDAAPETRARLRPWLERALEPSATIARAGSAYTSPPAGPGWLAIGDAAVAFDPLSSHGIGSAMTTGYYGACAAAEVLSGGADTGALATYADLVASLFDDYLDLLHQHYRREQRWPTSPFWARRRERLSLDSGR